ncbi:MAG TPA: ribosome biogenesis GTPase Der [Aggregatilineales bacterium]|nr:ribosome biogenesis GTPase Der [Anaerolineales bacterium]HRE49211.1 ribosome biogenesis GTPase Der [Aggregatilineales bacterium]
MRKPFVALVGRPNVGKSTLFNRLVEERKSVTSDIPGTTRDRLLADANWRGVEFTLIDTGGIEVYEPRTGKPRPTLLEGSVDFVKEIRIQALIAIEEADVVVMLVDAIDGITGADEEVAEMLRRTNKPILIAANKADNEERRLAANEFYALGLGEEVFPISALHGTGTGDLLDAVVDHLKQAPPETLEEMDESLKIAIVGRPNVGKSSLLNRLLGEERAIVSPIAGTTRDSIDTRLTWEGMPVTLIDTAGIRRRGSIEPGIEQFSVIRAFKALERADVALLLIDAVEGVTAQDLHIAGMIKEANRSVVIIVNKWDALEKDDHTLNEFTKTIQQRFDFIAYAPILFLSAKTGQRIHTVLPMAARVQEERLVRIPTGALNQLVRRAVERHSPTSSPQGRLKIYYVSQVRVDPPTFLFHVNDKELLHFTYERYLENQIREDYTFLGTPIRLSFRNRRRE